jgi:hypothetical protein
MSWDSWYHQTPDLLKKIDDLYAEATASGKTYTKLSVTQQKVVAARGWSPSLLLTAKNFDRVLTELDCFYVPKNVQPGPMVVFPIRDIEGIPTRCQTKPFEGSAEFGPHKYTYLGLKSKEFRGPCWLGNDLATLRRVIEQRRVVLVEGAFDILASRLVVPEDGVPVMSSLTKSLGAGHLAYLRMLGIDTLHLMFDNEKPKENYDIGGGELSMRALQRDVTSMKVDILYCPSSDPSECLKSYAKAQQLRNLLVNL